METFISLAVVAVFIVWVAYRVFWYSLPDTEDDIRDYRIKKLRWNLSYEKRLAVTLRNEAKILYCTNHFDQQAKALWKLAVEIDAGEPMDAGNLSKWISELAGKVEESIPGYEAFLEAESHHVECIDSIHNDCEERQQSLALLMIACIGLLREHPASVLAARTISLALQAKADVDREEQWVYTDCLFFGGNFQVWKSCLSDVKRVPSVLVEAAAGYRKASLG